MSGAAFPPPEPACDAVLAACHPLAAELACLRADELEAVLAAYDSLTWTLAGPGRSGYVGALAGVLWAVRYELRAALAARRLAADPADGRQAAWEAARDAAADERASESARAAWAALAAATDCEPAA